MSKALAIAAAVFVLVFAVVSLCSVSIASAASFSRPHRYPVIKRTETYDVVRTHHSAVVVRRHHRYVKVHGVIRYKIVRRARRFVSLRRVFAGGAQTLPDTVALSVGLPSWASSAAAGRGSDAGNDGDVTTRWSAGSVAYPQSWTVDLGSSTAVAGVGVTWYRSASRAYRYRIETSVDGAAFDTMVDHSRNAIPGASMDALDTTARYVRIEVLGASPKGAWAAAREITVLGSAEASDSDLTPTPTPTPAPAPSDSCTLAPSGGNDTAAIQSAVNACGTQGGTVSFEPGTYTITSPIRLPAANQSLLTLSGNGAKVVLDRCRGFLQFNVTRDYQSFRHFAVEGFELDASRRSATPGFCFIGADHSYSGLYVVRGSVEDVTIRDCTMYGAPSLDAVNHGCVWIALGCKQAAMGEPTWNYVRHITIDNVTMEGGDDGILVYGDVVPDAIPPSSEWPCDASMAVDDIEISNVRFDSGKTPTWLRTSHPNVAIMVGGWGRGGTLDVRDCYLKGSGDDLLEVDSMRRVTITNVDMADSHNLATTVRLFGYPDDAVVGTDEGSMSVTYTNCTVDQSSGVSSWSFGLGAEMRRSHPTYHVTYDNCRYRYADGVWHRYTGR